MNSSHQGERETSFIDGNASAGIQLILIDTWNSTVQERFWIQREMIQKEPCDYEAMKRHIVNVSGE